MKVKGEVTRSIGFQVFLYFVLAGSCAAGIVAVCGTAMLWIMGAYQENFTDYMRNVMNTEASSHLDYICMDRKYFADIQDIIQAFQRESEKNNVSYFIENRMTGGKCWSNVNEKVKESPYTYKGYFYRATYFNSQTRVWEDEEYMVTMYVDPDFPKEDGLRQIYLDGVRIHQLRWQLVGVMVAAVVFCIISMVWLLCNVGHRRGKEGITPGPLTNIYLDVLTVIFGTGGLALVVFAEGLADMGDTYWWAVSALALGGTAEVVWCMIYLCDIALRVKLGKTWRHSLVYVTLRFGWKLARWGGSLVWRLLRGIPSILHVVGLVCLLTLCEALGILMWGEAELFVIWMFEKLLLIPFVLYCALAFRKLCRGAEELAQGNLGYKLDTKYLVVDFREHGENLNRIGEGISKAVEQRMRSERLKTELITNVSHDIKTPLTSVINYADLLGKLAQERGAHMGPDQAAGGTEALQGDEILQETDEDARLAEYSEVLVRQSRRLKKLLDDLVDASKATAGTLEVSLEPCVIGVLLSQTLGEYGPRLEEKGLALHVSQPEEDVRILADGRYLWRVFDNLMSNISKYAQEGSRVYINVEQEGAKASVIFRNMSKYELNIPAAELEERFVRGDASRHMEGSGLGLPIARSLVELQGGSMEIVTDGDLFKVILEFDVLHN